MLISKDSWGCSGDQIQTQECLIQLTCRCSPAHVPALDEVLTDIPHISLGWTFFGSPRGQWPKPISPPTLSQMFFTHLLAEKGLLSLGYLVSCLINLIE